MAIPTLVSLSPSSGPASGGDLVRLRGEGIAERVRILFGERLASVVAVRSEGTERVVDVRTPAHDPGETELTLFNLGEDGEPIAGEEVTLTLAYRFVRSTVAIESNLTRAVRQLLRELKRQVLANVSTTVSVDYDDNVVDGLSLIASAKLPSLVLSGPTFRPNRFYAQNVLDEEVVSTRSGLELVRRKPPATVDLLFTVTAASSRTAELFNLMVAAATFFNRNRWLELLRDPSAPEKGTARWELDADGEFRTQLAGRDDVRAFSCGFVVRGFDVDEGLPLDASSLVQELNLQALPVEGGAS